MSKVIILGTQTDRVKKLNPIRFVKALRNDHVWKETKDRPSEFDNVELICEDYGEGWSLMFAYKADREKGILFLGYFNDGIIQ